MLTAMKNVDTLIRLTTNLINFSKANVYSSSFVYRNTNLIPIWKEYTMPFIVMQKPNRSNSDYKSNFEYQNVWFDKEKMDSITKSDFKCHQIYRPR